MCVILFGRKVYSLIILVVAVDRIEPVLVRRRGRAAVGLHRAVGLQSAQDDDDDTGTQSQQQQPNKSEGARGFNDNGSEGGCRRRCQTRERIQSNEERRDGFLLGTQASVLQGHQPP